MPPRLLVGPSEVALFWVQWLERVAEDRTSPRETLREALAPAGPVLCNDVDLAPAPPGRVAACVPFTDRAEARHVPIPREACRQSDMDWPARSLTVVGRRAIATS
jgi:hypothetical protein